MFGDTVREFKLALALLTRLPVRLDTASDAGAIAASAPMFPLAGALIGSLGALTYALALQLGLTAFLAAMLALACLVLVTGGLHEDGLADVADGLGGGRGRAEKLAIMRDPRLGSFGAMALVLTLLLRLGALTTLADPALVAAALIGAGALSRGLLPLAMSLLPAARADGLAVAAGRPHLVRSLAAAGIALLIALLVIDAGTALVASLVAAGAGGALAALARRQIGGVTGDVLGAMQQLAEIGFLLTVVAHGWPTV